MLPSISEQALPALASGEPVAAWTLRGAGGLTARVSSYGATVTHLEAPDRHGRADDVVLGFDSPAEYEAQRLCFGSTIGRVAGRLSGGRFVLDGQGYALECNSPPNHIHGGHQGFDRLVWRGEPVAAAEGSVAVRLRHHSPDGHEGYPGAVDVAVTFVVTPDNVLRIETEATTTRATLFSSTHHSYFNLAGHGAGGIDDHVLQIVADDYAPADDDMTLLGRRAPVSGLANDGRAPRRLGDVIPGLHQRHGDFYFLRSATDSRGSTGREIRPVARVYEPGSGRVLTVSTNDDGLQFYSAVGLPAGLAGKSGRHYGPHAAFCLECHGCPIAIDRPELGDIVLRPERPLRQVTAYAFSTSDAPPASLIQP